MVELHACLRRFLAYRDAPEDPPPGVERLWPESSADELDALLRERRRDHRFGERSLIEERWSL